MVAFKINALFSLWTYVQHMLIPVIGERLMVHTAKQSGPPYSYTKLSSHGYNVGDSTCIVIEAKVCSDLHIALMQKDDDTIPTMYEILLGGWGNTKSTIRKGKSAFQKVVRTLHGVVNCSEFRKFKFGWQCGNVVAYSWKTPGEWEELISSHDTSVSVNYIGVTTGYWTTGDWIIHNEGCSQETIWARDLALDNSAIQSSPRIIMNNPIKYVWKCAYLCQEDKGCCIFTYNEQQDCKGYSTITSYNASAGTQVWKRQILKN